VNIEVRDGPTAFDAPELMDGVLDVYAIAFGSPPWNESAERLASYRTRAIEGTTRADFTLAVARNDDERVVGFATAWTTPDPFPTGRLYDTIAATLDPPVLRDRLVGRTEVDELAVHPAAGRSGLGRALLNAVTSRSIGAWLVTGEFAEAAVSLYRGAGWEAIASVRSSEGLALIVFATPLSPDHIV